MKRCYIHSTKQTCFKYDHRDITDLVKYASPYGLKNSWNININIFAIAQQLQSI